MYIFKKIINFYVLIIFVFSYFDRRCYNFIRMYVEYYIQMYFYGLNRVYIKNKIYWFEIMMIIFCNCYIFFQSWIDFKWLEK